MQEATIRRPVIVIEAHRTDEHLRAEREIIELTPRQATLGAMSVPEPADDSLYSAILSMPALVGA
jgi:hypothetical protein